MFEYSYEIIKTHEVESQNFLDPILTKPQFSIKLGFKNTELGLIKH